MNIDPSLLQRAAAAATGHQHQRAGSLYVVATPIGNLADLSLRAIHVLGLVDALACEDTRVSAGLLAHLGLHKPLVALHEHNEQAAAGAILQRLAAGQSVALVSDAGTPAISDPGAWLVAAATAAGHTVVPVPGPSCALAAFSVAGDVLAQGFACRASCRPRARSAMSDWPPPWPTARPWCCSRRRTASSAWPPNWLEVHLRDA